MRSRVDRRVVVTGLGLVTPLGVGLEKNWQALIAGRSGIGRITIFDASAFEVDVAAEVNSEMPVFWVRKVADRLNDHGKAVRGSRVLVVGVAYKKDIDDIRESPALDVLRLLRQQGAVVSYHDPFIAQVDEDGERLQSVPLTEELVRSSDCVVIVTDHSALDYGLIRRAAPCVVDTRNALRAHA